MGYLSKTTIILFGYLLQQVQAMSIAPRNNWNSSANCMNFYADIYAEADAVNISSVVGGVPANQQAYVELYVKQYTINSTLTADIANAPKIHIAESFSTYFEYCTPKNGDAKGIFQAIHGVVGAAGYWSPIIDGKTDNSFVESAAAAGWATLSYDRLGVGKSAHPSGLDVVQFGVELEMVKNIAGMLRNNSMPNVDASYDKIVGIGHSYGSLLLASAASNAPNTFDGSVLTGFSNSRSSNSVLGLPGFGSDLANTAYPDRFGDLDNTYLSTPSSVNDQKAFLTYPNYTDNALEVFTQTKGEYSIGTTLYRPTVQASDEPYTKPTYIATGDRDTAFCGGNCYITSLGEGMTEIDTARVLFPNVSDSDWGVLVVPDTGHGLNFHTTAYSAYQSILEWVSQHV